jgi:hypothetical protein
MHVSHFEAKKPLLRNHRLPKALPDFPETIVAMHPKTSPVTPTKIAGTKGKSRHNGYQQQNNETLSETYC